MEPFATRAQGRFVGYVEKCRSGLGTGSRLPSRHAEPRGPAESSSRGPARICRVIYFGLPLKLATSLVSSRREQHDFSQTLRLT